MGSNSMDGIDGTIDGQRHGERTRKKRRDGRTAGCSEGQGYDILPANLSPAEHPPRCIRTHIHTLLRHYWKPKRLNASVSLD